MAYSFYLMRGLDYFGQSRKLLTGGFMTDLHPITPPPELVQQWFKEVSGAPVFVSPVDNHIAARAAEWGADYELEACCEYVYERLKLTTIACIAQNLRAARRPKPPSLKEQALDAWDRLRNEAWCEEIDHDLNFIRRALESIND